MRRAGSPAWAGDDDDDDDGKEAKNKLPPWPAAAAGWLELGVDTVR